MWLVVMCGALIPDECWDAYEKKLKEVDRVFCLSPYWLAPHLSLLPSSLGSPTNFIQV